MSGRQTDRQKASILITLGLQQTIQDLLSMLGLKSYQQHFFYLVVGSYALGLYII